MRVYFLSEIPCALTIGGACLGLVDGFERSAELDLSCAHFCRFLPFGEYLPVSFRLDEAFLLSPPRGITLYFTETALAIYASGFLRADQSMRVISQRRFRGALLTLVLQGTLQLYFENGSSEIITLPDYLADCSVEETGIGYLLSGSKGFALVSFEGKLLVASEGKVLSHDGELRAEIPFRDCLGHTAECSWRDGSLVSCTIKTPAKPRPATFALALFESALIGADCTPFLADSLIGKADALREYLGDFRSVVLTDEPDRVGLCYERKERVFDVRYFRVELENDGKIRNLRPEK